MGSVLSPFRHEMKRLQILMRLQTSWTVGVQIGVQTGTPHFFASPYLAVTLCVLHHCLGSETTRRHVKRKHSSRLLCALDGFLARGGKSEVMTLLGLGKAMLVEYENVESLLRRATREFAKIGVPRLFDL